MRKILTVILLLGLSVQLVQAQIIIGGNVYGGARQANVGGSTFVNIGADHHDVMISAVYGGNDISGTIGSSAEIPDEITDAVINGITTKTGDENGKGKLNENNYNTFVRISPEATKTTGEGDNAVTTQLHHIFIAHLFGGGNGDYTYGENESRPDVEKAYLEIKGGTVVNLYGGGNNATVTSATDICIDNSSQVTTSITDGGANSPNLLLTEGRLADMGLSALGEDIVLRDTYHFSRVFGGNNQAEMHIRPKWHLIKGNIDNLYSGGNAGPMTSPVGLLLEIPENSGVMVNNVYGGCRKADVHPLSSGTLKDNPQEVALQDIQLPASEGYHFPPGLSARVLVRGGNINNVYGGNDITGNVVGGNAVGIYTSVQGDVYGGGNGSYPYTDNDALKDNLAYGDYYYDPSEASSSVAALNAFRPNAQMVSLRVAGKDEDHPTIIRGAVYVGGNSATLTGSSASAETAAAYGLVTRPELKLGSHVIINEVFLGNNGANMVTPELLELMNGEVDGKKFSTIKLKDTSNETPDNEFAKYMNGCGMTLEPNVTFDDVNRTPIPDPETYEPYTAQIGSFYCGGNVGSVLNEGKISIPFNNEVIIYEKLVGGCNKAYVAKSDYNAEFFGGLIGSPAAVSPGSPEGTIGDKLEINLSGLKIQPKRWKDVEKTGLTWNTVNTDGNPVPSITEEGAFTPDDLNRRFDGGNIYGGCYESGHVNGNVIININSTLVDRTGENNIFDEVETNDETGEAVLYGHDSFVITKRNSGVILDQQGMDVLGKALNVFGGGYGEDSEIWGSTTINLNAGYTFQIFGGGEKGAIGKGVRNSTTGKLEYSAYDARYSTTVNLHNPKIPGDKRTRNDNPLMAEAEFIYGGGFLAPVCGNTTINLDNGRIFNSFAGSCNADILGHTETYVGVNGFPYIRDHIYGGNDLGGKILGAGNFQSRVRDSNQATENVNETLQMVHGYDATTNPNPDVLKASAYIEYQKGRVANIFGGCYGVYDYTDSYYEEYFDENGYARSDYTKPFLDNAFINFRPEDNQNNSVKQIYGAGQGYLGEKEENLMQNRSYVLIDIPQTMAYFQGLEVFGAGECGGVGMGVDKTMADAAATADKASAIIDLVRGNIKAVYGGSYEEGITRRTVVNVPEGSTVKLEKIFGGAYGIKNDVSCDVYEANVNWNSEDALVGGYRTGIYGGNNNYRRTLYGKVNINAPVYYDKENGYFATVYGAGYGRNTWSQYTEVNLNGNSNPDKLGARVYEVYGGGQLGEVMSAKVAAKWANAEYPQGENPVTPHPFLALENGYTDNGLVNDLAQYKYNTNVRINTGAEVCGYMYNGSLSGAYAYGGGLGSDAVEGAGDVYGTTFIGLFGGKVVKDIYAAGTIGSVNNRYLAAADDDNSETPFVATTNAHIEGGTCRNVYGGGWKGSVGYHAGDISQPYKDNDVYGATNVIIGKLDGTSFVDGIPAIERNAYGGGEGGPVYGTAYITMNKGYIGYRHFSSLPALQSEDSESPYLTEGTGENTDYYLEKLHDETWDGDGTNRLSDSGCIFGGGYIDNSNVDITNVKMYGGHVRNALFGGGEIAAIGRGDISVSGDNNSVRTLNAIYKAGKTNVELYKGHVHRNVFGGGRGYNNVGNGGTLYSDGFVFGQTEVNIYGGEVGTAESVAKGDGNVFGGGDIGYVYSAYEDADGGLCIGQKDGVRYDDNYEGYYYKRTGGSYDNGEYKHPNDQPKPENATDLSYLAGWEKDPVTGEYMLSEDCKVLVEPHCIVTEAAGVDIDTPDADGNLVSTHYDMGQYVPTSALNTLQNKNNDKVRWECLDTKGIIIHNAVFAGGNTSSGSAKVYANATTVFGNATASIHDVYHRDLITVGASHTGGLYGDGNLTFVDGYRGLNITNYGTDYYTISDNREISIEQYHLLDDREAAYYELRYICVKDCTDKEGTNYTKGDGDKTKPSVLNADDLLALFTDDEGNPIKDGETPLIVVENGERVPNPDYWKENGVCTIYAGRPMNTIQRADFCGVFGSRMVMQGAQDRVPEIVDHTNYTINRVREVSLNQQYSVISSDLTTYTPDLTSGTEAEIKARKEKWIEDEGYEKIEKAIHGNYFGIYNIVNFLGGLTSDQHFSDVRITENTSNTAYKASFTLTEGTEEKTYNYGDGLSTKENTDDNASYYKWKEAHKNDRMRNNGRSHNKVALASGVYLELTTEKSTGKELDEKDWGYITGIIELDLINVQQGVGGGFVYAKNEHRTWTYNKKNYTTLTALNKEAVTRKDFDYSETYVPWETSGNFVHSSQIIIDDCYNISGKYEGSDAVPAHYWYIRGQVYVYDQYISAYTGAPNAYSETVDIPLTITAASQGEMKLLNIQPNKYAYWKKARTEQLGDGKLLINDATYYLNDPISYWEWQQLSKASQELFVDETYVTIADCKIGDAEIAAGTVMLPGNEDGTEEGTYNYWKKQANGTVYQVDKKEDVDFDFVFRSSNNISHNTGYILTYKMNNPTLWDSWYTPIETGAKNQTSKNDQAYYNGPTYHLVDQTSGLFGQRQYEKGNVIAEDIYLTYQAIANDNTKKAAIDAVVEAGREQAQFEAAYLLTKEAEISDGNDGTIHLNPGSAVSATIANAMPDKTSPAYICNSTIQISATEFIYLNTKMTTEERAAYLSRFEESDPALHDEIAAHVVPAYYCTKDGYYGGDYYQQGMNYRALAAWCSMSADDRQYFEFNYDALDVLIDPDYGGTNKYKDGDKYQYDSKDATLDGANANPAGYSIVQPVDYTATYSGDGFSLPTGTVLVKHKDAAADAPLSSVSSITDGDELSRTEYEKLPNEQRFYAPIKGDAENENKCYVVVKPLVIGNTPYAVGSTTTEDIYNERHGEGKGNEVIEVTLPDAIETYYFCRESYEIGKRGGGQMVKAAVASTEVESGNAIDVNTEISTGGSVPAGFIIAKGSSTNPEAGTYGNLINQQKGFTIHGIAPTETSTLFVSRNSDIYDLSKDKIITVIYQYDYEESDGDNVTPVSERHVVNIHLQFKSGIPTVEDIRQPQTVIPGDYLGMREPIVTSGAYEVTGGGWELFENASDAESHINGISYTPGSDPLYWYQDGYYLAYYATTYLGKTYSNHLPVSVANYHDLKKVMDDKTHHYYVDDPNVKRNSKIYINDATDGLNQLRNFFDLSVLSAKQTTGALAEHELLDSYVKGGANLEFILHTDINHSVASKEWEPIGNDVQCFAGNLHGDGHTVNGIDNSLFGNLCGRVYNLGVTGTFSSAGIADRGMGYVENCWVSSKTNVSPNVKAVFGSPSRTTGIQVVNCYYPSTNNYSTTVHPRGNATAMPVADFYNGTVAYNLNGFYLYKRYCDQKVTSGASYKYFTVKSDDNSLILHDGSEGKPLGYYGNDPSLSTAGNTTTYAYNGYVEDRFADGDFRYSEGVIPEPGEKRAVTTTTTTEYYPIWPDDYIYFGQMLTYGWNDLRPHEETPSSIYKESSRLVNNDKSNRVYRAPAYYQSSTMGVAHFNPSVNLVAYEFGDDDKEHPAYPNMTAIDFCGHNDTEYTKGTGIKGFYQPLLDEDGIVDIVNRDETPNLLAYAPSSETNSKTFDTLKKYFVDDKEPAYAETDLNGNSEGESPKYRCVAAANTGTVVGHMVTSDLTTLSDHLLIDEKDFDCPIGYQMGSGKRMWYQRLPERYVDTSNGWETVSLPFTAELVTTQQKGEITHFYGGSKTEEGSDAKIGHEYWLREFNGKKSEEDETVVAIFDYPVADGSDKIAANTFLWEYYYKANTQKDANADTYQTYYETARSLNNYSPLTNGKPYIIGFPGITYREFDLSGNWVPSNTATTPDGVPAQLDRQTITFASAPAATIGVSDDEKAGTKITEGEYKTGYTFKSNYLEQTVEDGYQMNADGNSFVKSETMKALPFRPYFVFEQLPSSAPRRTTAQKIVFDSGKSSFAIGDEDPSEGLSGELILSTRPHMLVTSSSLRQPADVHVYNISGQSVASFTIQPGETIETPIYNSGVYIIRAARGYYTKKITLK